MVIACIGVSPFAAAEEKPTDTYAVIGRFQDPDERAEKDIPGQGLAEITINAPIPVKMEGYAAENLAIQFEMKITRTDGVTGAGSLQWVRNGWVKLADSSGNERLKTASPTQAMPESVRAAPARHSARR